MVNLTDTELNQVMEVLGLTREDFLAVKQAPNIIEAREVLRVLKEKAHRGFRRAAKKLHPDLNGGDEAQTQLFIHAKAVVDHIQKIQLREPPPVHRFAPMRMRVVYGSGFASSVTSATTTTSPWGSGTVYQVRTYG